jgi:hypothetical protein
MKKEESDMEGCKTKVLRPKKKSYYKSTLKDNIGLLLAGCLEIGKLYLGPN